MTNKLRFSLSKVVNRTMVILSALPGLFSILNTFLPFTTENRLMQRFSVVLEIFFWECILFFLLILAFNFRGVIFRFFHDQYQYFLEFIAKKYQIESAKIREYVIIFFIINGIIFVALMFEPTIKLIAHRSKILFSTSVYRELLYKEVEDALTDGLYPTAIIKLDEIDKHYPDDIRDTYRLRAFLRHAILMSETISSSNLSGINLGKGYTRAELSRLLTSFAYYPRPNLREEIKRVREKLSDLTKVKAKALYDACKDSDEKTIQQLFDSHGWLYFEEEMIRKMANSSQKIKLISEIVLGFETSDDFVNFCNQTWMLSRIDSLLSWKRNTMIEFD